MNEYMRTALFRNNQPLSCDKVLSVDGFEIEGTQPINTDRRIVFSYEGDTQAEQKYYKLIEADGLWKMEEVCKSGLNVNHVLAEGNTVAELEAVKTIPEWVGKNIYPIIALKAPETQNAVPTLQVKIKTTPAAAQYEMIEESPIYELSKTKVKVISIEASDIEKTGNGAATVEVRFKEEEKWSEYIDIKKAANAKATSAQFRIVYSVSTLGGTNSVKVGKVIMKYADAETKVSGTDTELVIKTKHYDKEENTRGLAFVQSLIRHKELEDAQIKGYVAFRDRTKYRKNYQIGVGTGKQQTIPLLDEGIRYNSFTVKVNGLTQSNFWLNTESNEVTVKVDSGSLITASYEYGWTREEWQEMTKIISQEYGDSGEYSTVYQYALGEEESEKTITAVKFGLNRPSEQVKDEVLGIGTGDLQIFELEHYAKADTIECTGIWSYDEQTKILQVEQTKGEPVKITYEWIGESPEVYALECGWAKKV